MAYIRIKKIKKNEYAYLVESSWKNGTSRQKVKGYLGRIYRIQKIKSTNFLSYVNHNSIEEYLQNNPKEKIISDVICWELLNHGFEKDETGTLKLNEFHFNPVNNELKNTKKRGNCVLHINDGFLCNETIKKIYELSKNIKQEDELEPNERAGFQLAKAFIESGISIPQELFVGFFKK